MGRGGGSHRPKTVLHTARCRAGSTSGGASSRGARRRRARRRSRATASPCHRRLRLPTRGGALWPGTGELRITGPVPPDTPAYSTRCPALRHNPIHDQIQASSILRLNYPTFGPHRFPCHADPSLFHHPSASCQQAGARARPERGQDRPLRRSLSSLDSVDLLQVLQEGPFTFQFVPS